MKFNNSYNFLSLNFKKIFVFCLIAIFFNNKNFENIINNNGIIIFSNCFQLKSQSQSKSQMKTTTTTQTKGDIPKFCDRESTPIAFKFKKANKLRSKSSHTPSSSKQEITINNSNISNTVIYMDLMYNILIIYLILFLLSYLKWYEQMYIVIYNYIYRTFYGFIDLSKENDRLIHMEKTQLDNKINISGKEII